MVVLLKLDETLVTTKIKPRAIQDIASTLSVSPIYIQYIAEFYGLKKFYSIISHIIIHSIFTIIYIL